MRLLRALQASVALSAGLLLAGCGTGGGTAEAPAETVTVTVTAGTEDPDSPDEADSTDETGEDSQVPEDASGSTFQDGVLSTSELRIKITRHEVIDVGAPGNEYGDKPVIAFWYETTNLSDDEVDPSAFIFHFNALQDNNPDAINELEVGMLPDDRFLETQSEKIKQGGTVECAIAYELDDTVTPVELVAYEGFDEVLGSAVYELK